MGKNMVNNDLQIVTVKDLLDLSLGVPLYQRPYRWTPESALLLFNDIYNSFKDESDEYRIGTAILHRETHPDNKTEYKIVDGQQRITTLSLLMYAVGTILGSNYVIPYLKFLKKDNLFNALSVEAIRNNYEVLKTKCVTHDKKDLKSFVNYILENCTFVKIVTNSEQQAFQFFDSQNSRGKELAPHDLLKSYHLREMSKDSEKDKKLLIGEWEKLNQKKLADCFSYHFFPLIKWYKKEFGINYSVKDIKDFKGINSKDAFNYVYYQMAVEKYYDCCEHNKQENFQDTKYQLTQPIVAGKKFFAFTLHYYNLLKTVDIKIQEEIKNPIIQDTIGGNGYVRNLLINITVFFADRFGINQVTRPVILKFYKWAYSLRLVMYSVYIETVNNYALGSNNRANEKLNMFYRISEMKDPVEIETVLLQDIKKEECKYNQKDRLWNDLFGDKK